MQHDFWSPNIVFNIRIEPYADDTMTVATSTARKETTNGGIIDKRVDSVRFDEQITMSGGKCQNLRSASIWGT